MKIQLNAAARLLAVASIDSAEELQKLVEGFGVKFKYPDPKKTGDLMVNFAVTPLAKLDAIRKKLEQHGLKLDHEYSGDMDAYRQGDAMVRVITKDAFNRWKKKFRKDPNETVQIEFGKQ
jgi:hypothetical protein